LGSAGALSQSTDDTAEASRRYSEFKQDLRAGNVVDCAVREDDIVGQIQLKTAEAKKAPEASPSAKIKESTPTGGEKQKMATPAPPKSILFRTVRVEDPDLVRDLEKANVKFAGVRPGFLSQFLWSWVAPIGLMFLLWSFLSRRIRGMGQSILGFGSSRARLMAEQDTAVTFGDVAGCDEAKYGCRKWLLS